MKNFINIKAITNIVLGREQSMFQNDLLNNHAKLVEQIRNKNILVIGGAGTIGSSYIKAILQIAEPKKCIVVDINENGLTELIRDIRSSLGLHIPKTLITYPVNFNDPVFYKIIQQEGPFEIIANFAAHKHVRSEKDIFSIEAMVQNNVINAEKFLDQVRKMGSVEHFFAVSTDKAANPVSVMGASKKLMEDILMSYSAEIPITTARFANVAFSNGSLLQGFIDRMMKSQPLSSPNNIRRYFVSPDESGQICMMACLLGKSSDIFFPKLDPAKDLISFSDIAIQFLEYYGYKPLETNNENEAKEAIATLAQHPDQYPVYFFESDTSGEKTYEEFYTDNEKLDMNSFEKLGIIKDTIQKPILEVKGLVADLSSTFSNTKTSKSVLVDVINKYIPNFSHIETGKNLDQKM